MTGYTRQDAILDGESIDGVKFNSEYDQLVAAFNAATGHTHDGSVGEGAPISGTVATYSATRTYVIGEVTALSDILYISKVVSNINNSPEVSPTQWTTVVSNLIDELTPQLGGDLDTNGKTLNGSSYVQIADATLASGTHTFNYTSGDMQQLTATGAITVAFSNMPTGKVVSMVVDAINWGAFTITLPVGMIFAAATTPVFTAAGTDRLLILKDKDEVFSMFIIGQGVA